MKTASGWTQRQVLSPPCVLEAANASCIFNALENAVPSMRVDAINMLARHMKFVFYVDWPDAASSNLRKQRALASKVADNVIYFNGPCAAHAVTRAINEERMTCDVYSIQFVVQPASHQHRLVAVMRRYIKDNLVIIDARCTPPPAHYKAHTEDMLRRTIGLRGVFVRARAGYDLQTSKDVKEVERRIQNYLLRAISPPRF